MSPEDNQQKLGQILSKCWKDAAFKQKFVANPKQVLADFGIPTPAGVDVKVVENTENQVYITLPPPPAMDQKDAETQGFSAATILSASKIRGLKWFYPHTNSSQNGSTCYKDCIPW